MQINVGDTVCVRGGLGRDYPEDVTVTNIGREEGRDVFDYFDDRGRPRWAYTSQISEIVERAA